MSTARATRPLPRRHCDERCEDARGNLCTCSCEGENHGLGSFGEGLATRAFAAALEANGLGFEPEPDFGLIAPSGHPVALAPNGWPRGYEAWAEPTPAAPPAGPVAVRLQIAIRRPLGHPQAVPMTPNPDLWRLLMVVVALYALSRLFF